MKLLTYQRDSYPAAGVLAGDRVIDVASLLDEAGGVRDVRALLELPDSPLERLRAALSKGAADGLPLSSVRLRAPILQPPTLRDHIIYEEHATQQHTREISEAWYRLPVFYFSNPLRIFGPDETIPYPAAAQRLDYELELGAVIGKEGSDILEADADPYIAGFTIFNDWSCRDLQRDEMQFGLGPAKGKDSASSLGPWVVTMDELAPYWRDGRLQVSCSITVNGTLWMEGHAGNGYFSWGSILERDAQDSRIVPGDVIGSGTIGGGSIGEAIRKGFPARFLEPGDVVEMEVEAIGVLRNTIGPVANPNRSVRWKARELPPMPETLHSSSQR